MAIYKPPKARWPLAVFAGVAGLILGTALGLLLGREDPDAIEGVRLIQQEMTAAAAGLEVVGIEYDEAVDGQEVVSETEYGGAFDALTSSRERFESVRDALALLSPGRVETLNAAYDAIEGEMNEPATEEDVQALLDDLSDSLKGDL